MDMVPVALAAILALAGGAVLGFLARGVMASKSIKQAEEKEIEVRAVGDLGEPASHVRKMFVPPKGEGAEMLNGGAAEVAQRIQEIVQEKLA